MQIHIELPVNFAFQIFGQLVELLLLLVKHGLQFWIFFSVDILEVFELVTVARLDILFVELLSIFHGLYKLPSECINLRSMLLVSFDYLLTLLLLFIRQQVLTCFRNIYVFGVLQLIEQLLLARHIGLINITAL
jgi:hypothetical protein